MQTISLKTDKFDIDLRVDSANLSNSMHLTLTLRLGFTQVNPAGKAAEGTMRDYGKATGTQRKIIKWDTAAWNAWRSNFVKSAQAYWNNRFTLLNPGGFFPFEAKGKTLYPNARCYLKLVAEKGGQKTNHHDIKVVRLHASENWFGSHWKLYDSKDTDEAEKGTDSTGAKIMQRAHVHEIGHLLGLPHVAVGQASCPKSGNTNAPACYGATDEEMRSVMGRGMELRLEHAEPWQSAMIRVIKANNLIRLLQGTLPPADLFKMVRKWDAQFGYCLPRTAAEIKVKANPFNPTRVLQ